MVSLFKQFQPELKSYIVTNVNILSPVHVTVLTLLEQPISQWRWRLTTAFILASGEHEARKIYNALSCCHIIKYKIILTRKVSFLVYGCRMVMFSNNVEPANGFLLRYLHRKAVESYQDKEQDSAHHQALLCVLDWVPQLWYHLHAFLEKHSTSDFLIGEIHCTQLR